jgi:NAD(P)-dependent dehydrogenase (short-subunit alcohol dehydrogenase family)
MARRFAQEGARAVFVVDKDAEPAEIVAAQCGGIAVVADVARESDIQALVAEAYDKFGQIDLFCSNAGVMLEGGLEVSDSQWHHVWKINFLSHVYAARAVVPRMLEQGSGYLLQTASAAGLLTQVGAAPYSVTQLSPSPNGFQLPITGRGYGFRVFARKEFIQGCWTTPCLHWRTRCVPRH